MCVCRCAMFGYSLDEMLSTTMRYFTNIVITVVITRFFSQIINKQIYMSEESLNNRFLFSTVLKHSWYSKRGKFWVVHLPFQLRLPGFSPLTYINYVIQTQSNYLFNFVKKTFSFYVHHRKQFLKTILFM